MAIISIRKFESIESSIEFELVEIKHEELKTRRKNPKAIMKELFFKLTNQRYQNINFEITYSGRLNSVTTYEEHPERTYMTIYELQEK